MQGAVYPDLAGRVVLVTGGASGIGSDIVRAFVAQGARVGFLDILAETGAALIEAQPPDMRANMLFMACDLTDVPATRAAISEVAARLGPVGVLVNNAANDTRHAVAAVTPEMWDSIEAVNLKAQFFAAQAVAPVMQAAGAGAIINLSSVAWRFGADQMPVYATAKAGVIGLTRALARAFGPNGTRVNAIEPGAVMTERQRVLWYPTEASVEAMVARQMLRRVLLGEDIARMVLFLASAEARMITGQTFVVDAGIS